MTGCCWAECRAGQRFVEEGVLRTRLEQAAWVPWPEHSSGRFGEVHTCWEEGRHHQKPLYDLVADWHTPEHHPTI